MNDARWTGHWCDSAAQNEVSRSFFPNPQAFAAAGRAVSLNTSARKILERNFRTPTTPRRVAKKADYRRLGGRSGLCGGFALGGVYRSTSVIWVEAVLFFSGLTCGNGIVFVDETPELYCLPVDHDFSSPSFFPFVPVDTGMTGSVCYVEFLVEAVNAVCDIAEVFDAVIGFVLVFMVDDVCWPLAVNDEPNDSVRFVSFPIDTDSSVSISWRSSE